MAGPEYPCHIKPNNVFILCGTNNLFQDLPEDIADGIAEIAQKFQSSYNSINIAIGGRLHSNASWSINWVLIKEVNQILKVKCSKSFFIYIGYDSCWTLQMVHLTQTSSFQIMCT